MTKTPITPQQEEACFAELKANGVDMTEIRWDDELIRIGQKRRYGFLMTQDDYSLLAHLDKKGEIWSESPFVTALTLGFNLRNNDKKLIQNADALMARHEKIAGIFKPKFGSSPQFSDGGIRINS